MQAKRAVSPLIATIILIAITIAGGLVIYSNFLSSSSILGAKAQISIENVKLVKDSSGDAYLSLTIKNTGNKPVDTDGLVVKLAGEDVSVALGSPLQPGQSVSFVGVATPPAEGFVIGNTYTLTIEATFVDGSSFSDAIAVMCTSA